MRVTLDKDRPINVFRLLKSYFNMKRLVGVDEIRESSRKGYHLISRGNSITHEDMLKLRRHLGGDPNRIKFDKRDNEMPKQVLWKNKERDGRMFESEEISEKNLLSLPFKSKLPRGVYVEKCDV